MKIPKKIKIGSYVIDVQIVDDPEFDSRGEYLIYRNIIKIKKDMTEQQKFSTFIHECIECISDLHDLKLKETHIRTLEQELTNIFKQLVKQ